MGLVLLMLLGIPVAIVLMLMGMIGMWALVGSNVVIQSAYISWAQTNKFVLTAVPLFIFMAEICVSGGVSGNLYRATRLWLSRLPGSVICSTNVACTIFAAISGSSTATAAAIATFACPEIEKYKIDKSLALGALAAGGTLGTLIPPSISMIVFSSMTMTSASRLFMGGLIPGIMMSLIFMVYILLRVRLNPSLDPVMGLATWKERFGSLPTVLPSVLLIGGVLGGMYTGIMTPTEAAGIGAFLAIAIVIVQRKLGVIGVLKAARAAALTTSAILLIVIGAQMVTFVFGYLGLPKILAELIKQSSASPVMIYIYIISVYFILGMFMDALSLMVVTVPFVFPIAMAQGWDPVWFGVINTLLCEIGLLTPPVGLALFVVDRISGGKYFSQIITGAIPFVLFFLVALALVYWQPQIILWLPGRMR